MVSFFEHFTPGQGIIFGNFAPRQGGAFDDFPVAPSCIFGEQVPPSATNPIQFLLPQKEKGICKFELLGCYKPYFHTVAFCEGAEFYTVKDRSAVAFFSVQAICSQAYCV